MSGRRIASSQTAFDAVEDGGKAEQAEDDQIVLVRQVVAAGPAAVGSDVVFFGRDAERFEIEAGKSAENAAGHSVHQ